MDSSTSISHKTLEASKIDPTLIRLFFSLRFLICFSKTFFCSCSQNNHKNGQMKLRIYLFVPCGIFVFKSTCFSKIRLFGQRTKKLLFLDTVKSHTRIFLFCHNFQIRLHMSTNALRLTTQNSFPSERQKTT